MEPVRDLQKAEMRIYAEHRRAAASNLTALWGVILGQCTPVLQEELRAEDDYDIMSASYDSIWLLKTLQKVTAGVHKTTNQYHSLFHALKDFYYIRQKEGESVEEYYRSFEAAQDLVALSKGSVTDLSEALVHEQKTLLS